MNIGNTIRRLRRSRAGKALATLVCVLILALALLILASAPSSGAYGAKVLVDPFEINGTAGSDQIRIYRDGTDIIIEGLGPDITLTGVEAITINAGDGNDTLTVDFSGGNPIPSGGITYNGEGNGSIGDNLELTGGSLSLASYGYSGLSDGFIELDGSIITYTGLEPVQDTIVGTLTVNGTNANNAITYVYGPNSGTGIFTGLTSGLVAVDAYETIEFANKTSLVLNADAGDDHVVLNNPSVPTSLTTITVNGGEGDDVVDLYDVGAGLTGPVALNGDAGDDLFKVKPSASAVVNVDGGDHIIGDVLVVDPMGGTAEDTGSAVLVTGYAAVNYTNIETVIIQGLDPDLSIAKTDHPDPVYAGQELFYDITVTNNADYTTASGVVVTDTLPAEVTYIADTASCVRTPGPPDVLVCTLDDIAPGGSRSFQIKTRVAVTSTGTTVIANTAEVTMTNGLVDTIPANNTVTEGTFVEDSADLSLTKSAPFSTLLAGDTVTFGLSVTNGGPSAAENVVVRDYMPDGVTVIGTLPTTVACIPGTPGDPLAPLTCNLGTIANGDTVGISITVRIHPDYPTGSLFDAGVLDNGAEVSSDVFDPDNSDNMDSVSPFVYAEADLGILKLVSPDPLVAGEEVTYLIGVMNLGPSTARDVRVFDRIPARATYVSDTLPGAGSCEVIGSDITIFGFPVITAGSLRCDLGDMEPGEIEEFSITLRVSSDVEEGDTIWNIAIVASLETLDSDYYSNFYFAEADVVTQADLEIEKTSEPDEVHAGEYKKYTISVHNSGPSNALNVTVTDTLPSSVTYDVNTDNCAVTGTGPNGEQILTCTDGPLKPSETWEFDIWALVDPAAPLGVITNTAQVTGTTTLGDPDPGNDTATARNPVVSSNADLKVTKFGEPSGQVEAGQYLTYTIVVDNLGPGFAHGVEVIDELVSSGVFDLVSINPDVTGLGDPGTICRVSDAPNNPGIGHLDAVFANARQDEPNRLCVGDGAGNFTCSDLSTDTNQSDGVALGDVNGDGNLDAVVANSAPSEPNRLCLGDGTGNFTCSDLGTDTNNSEDVALGDVDGDGNLDAVFANSNGQRNRLCVGDGTGNFTCSDVSTTDTNDTYEVALGDVDGDGHLDAVFVNYNQYNRVCLGNGAGSFTCSDVSPETNISEDVALGDVDGDGNLDAVVGNTGPGEHNRLCLGDGTGNFTCSDVSADTNNSYGVALGDVDGDGHLDAVFANGGQHNRLCLGDGTGNFTCSDLSADTYQSFDVALGDVNGDGHLDAVVANFNQPNRVCLGDGAGNFTCSDVSADTNHSDGVALGDVNAVRDINQRLELTCELGGMLELLPDARWIIEIVVTADETQDINNVAHVTSADFDPDMSNNQAEVEHDITDVCDLEIAKAAVGEVAQVPGGAIVLTPDQVTAGRTLTYTLVITNHGPSTAENVVVKDRLPPWVVVTSTIASQGTCTTGTPGDPDDKLTCGLGTVISGTNAAITITAEVLPWVPAGTVLENDALVYSDIWDPTDENDRAYNLTTVNAVADLEITKENYWLPWSDPPGPAALAGAEFTYRVVVTNTGPSTARNVVVKDILPPGQVEYVSSTGNCVEPVPDRELECSLGAIPPNETEHFFITVKVDSDLADSSTITNMVQVSSSTPDPSVGTEVDNNTYERDTLVLTQADLEIEKWTDRDKIYAGEQVKYTISVHNIGPSDALNVVVTDTLPISVTYELDTDNCAVTRTGPNGEQILTCTDGTLKPCETWEFDIWVLVDPAASVGVITNTVEVTGTTTLSDPNLENNTATAKNLVVSSNADLKITKFGNPIGQVEAGQYLTYTIMIDNLGPGFAHGVTLYDVIQSDLTFELVSVESNRPFTCTTEPPVLVPDDLPAPFNQRLEMTCALSDALEVMTPSTSGRWMITMTVTADETQDVNNVATVTSADFDPDTSNNQAEVEHEITDVSDLEITKTAVGEVANVPGPGITLTPDQVTAGRSLTYTLVITNYGPSTAENVKVYDRLPPGVVVTSATPGQGSCSTGTPGDSADKLTCGLGTLISGTNTTIIVTAAVDPALADGSILENDAFVVSDNFDQNDTNDFATNLTGVSTAADVSVQKTDRPDHVLAGEQLEYTFVVTNTGPSVARDVVLYDQLPVELIGLDVYVINEPNAACDIATTPPYVIDCGLGDMAVGKGIVIVATTLVDSGVPDSTTITNMVQVSSPTLDPTLGTEVDNNIDEEDTLILTQADLEIEKTSEPDKVYAGEQVKYTISVHNIGPSDALNVTATDTLPISVTYETDTDNCAVTGIDPVTGGQILTCTDGTLKPCETWEFDIWALVDPAIVPNTFIINTAEVTGTTTLGDPNDENNIATAKNLVLQKADLKITKFGKPDGQVEAGQILTYTIVVDNLGPSYAGIDGRNPVIGNVAVKDILQSDLEFDLLEITSDREMACSSVPTDGDPTDGVAGVDEHLEIDCTLLDALEVLSAGGPPNPGRWIITMTVTADETQDINNVAHVVSDAFDPNLDNNQAEAMHEITDVSDLEITKAEIGEVRRDSCDPPFIELQPNEVTAGFSLTYTLVATNYGPSTAENVVVEDRLPPSIVVTSAEASQGACDTGTPGDPLDKLTCGLGTLAVNASATITITADVPSWVTEGTILENDALVYSDIWDPTNENNFATNLTTVSAWADLGISKSARGDNVTGYDEVLRQFIKEQRDSGVTAGELLQYTLVISNTGPSDAQNVVITDTLPPPAGPIATVHFVEADGATCRQDPIDRNELTCELGTMAVGEVRTVYILVRVDPSVLSPPDIRNTATVDSTTADPCLDNNTTTNDTEVNTVADIFITKVDVPAEVRLNEPFEPDQAIAGNEHRYLITFGNDGPSVARSVNITDTLDFKQGNILGETFVRCEPLDPDDLVECSEEQTVVVNDTVRLQTLKVGNESIISGGTGTLNSGESFSFYLITKVDSGYVLDADDLIAENTAWISSTTTDVRTANNQDTEQTEIIAEADLKVSKTDTPDPGQNLYYDPVTQKFVYTYTLTIENLGPSDAAKVVLIDTLPVDATFTGFGTLEDTQCYFRDDGVVFCLVGKDPNNQGTSQSGRLNVGSSKVVEIFVEADASAVDSLENCVEVKAIAEADFPFRPTDPIKPADFVDGRTPTSDPNLANNSFCETTTLVTPEVKVNKKVYVRRSPARGIDRTTDGLTEAERCAAYATDDILTLPGDELTYCYTVTNEGDTWLHSITVRDAATTIVRTPTSDFAVAYPSQPPLRGTITVAGIGDAQTITIATPEPAKAVLAPKGVADDYDHILIVRSFTVDFPAGGLTYLGTNTARVDARPSTKYSTPLAGIEPSGDCDDPDLVCDTDLLHDTLALPMLEDTTKEWDVYDDVNEDGLPGCGEIIVYTVTIRNTGAIEATGVVFTDILYNYIADDPDDPRVPATLVNGSVSAAIHVYGLDPVTGREIDADVQPPDLAFGEDLLLRTEAPTADGGYIELTYLSAIVLDSEIIKGNNAGDDEVLVATRLAIPPRGDLLRFDGVTYDPPIPVTFSLRIKYRVYVKDTTLYDTVVLNHGWLTYNEMGLFDQRYSNFDPANPNAHTAANKAANYHDGTPGRAWESHGFPGWPEVPEDVEPTDYPGPRFDNYALLGAGLRFKGDARLDAGLRDDDDPTWFEVKCGTENSTDATGTHLQLPVIAHGDGWETRIQVQNAGDDDTGVVVFFWGEYSGQCPYNDPGPVGYACKLVDDDGVWSVEDGDIPTTARSAIVYSVDEDSLDQACLDAAYVLFEPYPLDPRPKSAKWQDWVDDYEGTGEPLAVVSHREGFNDYDTLVSSAHAGISENMKGCGPPYQYFAPYAMRQYQNLDTEMIIQNCGRRCTEVWLDYQKQGDCAFSYSEEIGRLAPGESIRKRVPEILGADWLGSIFVEAEEPLGIVIDQTSFLPSDDRGALLTYDALSYKLTKDKVFYADLVFREWSGWEASIQVQNMTQDSMPTFVTVEFFDASGDSILFLGDWVCLHGGTTFYMPAVIALGMQYAGAAVIESHAQVDYPGGVHDGEPIFVVVDLKKTKVYDEALHSWRPTIPGEIQGGAYNARAESDTEGAGPIFLPFLAKAKNDQGVTSLIAVRNNSNCNNIGLRLEVRKGTGTMVTYVHNFWLSAGHVGLIDFANVGSVNPGFSGSGTIEITDVQQLCDLDNDGQADQEPVMPSVVVVNRGAGSGDITAVYKGIRGGTHQP